MATPPPPPPPMPLPVGSFPVPLPGAGMGGPPPPPLPTGIPAGIPTGIPTAGIPMHQPSALLPPPPPNNPTMNMNNMNTSSNNYNTSISSLSKLSPNTLLLTHIPPFLRHPRNLRDLLYSTTTVKHVFYSCPIKRFSNDNCEDDKNDNVVAVIKLIHTPSALSFIRNWDGVKQKLNSIQKQQQQEEEKSSSSSSSNNCQMNAFLLYTDGPISLHPEKSQVDANMIETIWELVHQERNVDTDAGKVATIGDENMIQTLVEAYCAIQKRQQDLDANINISNGQNNSQNNNHHSSLEDSHNNINNDNNNNNNEEKTTEAENDTTNHTSDHLTPEPKITIKLDTQKVRAAAGGGAYDEEADPLNAPEILEAVSQFKKRLEITQSKNKRNRKEYVDKRLKEEILIAKKRLIQQRKEMEEKQKELVARQQSGIMPPPPLPPSMDAPLPPLPPGGMPPLPSGTVPPQDTGKRGLSNLPSWMTASNNDHTTAVSTSNDGNKRSADENELNESQPRMKKKFIPSEANRDINMRKERLIMDDGTGAPTSLAAIRAANEAADRAKIEEEENAKKEKIKAEFMEYLKEAKSLSSDQIISANTYYPRLQSPESIPTIRKYVKEQMVEYLGEEEATLIDFVMNYIVKQENNDDSPYKGKSVVGLLEEMKLVLDEDAETFVVDLFQKIVEESKI